MLRVKFPNAVRQDLARSGLTTADARQLRIKALGQAFRIPYFHPNGTVNGFYRDKLLGLKLPIDKGGKPKRYDQPPDTTPRLYMPPLNVDWEKVANDPAIEVLITEGEKKSAAACKNGFACIGLGGCWNWRSKGAPIPDLDDIEWQKRGVYIVFDSDAAQNSKVRQAERELQDELKGRSADVRIVRLPPGEGGEKVGLDDFLVANGPGALRSLLRGGAQAPEGITFADLADKDFPPVRWIIPGLIPVGLTLLNGKSKIGKSWLAVGLSVAVANGSEALGVNDGVKLTHLAG